MTDKEQIIIDGVDVSKCEFYMHYDYGKFSHGCSLHKDMFGLPVCCDIADCCKDCYFKQLARKTQECEELKRKLSNQEQLYQNEIEIYDKSCLQLRQENDDLYLERLALNTANSGINALLEVKEQECDRYRKALEEIERYINNQGIDNKWNMRIQRFRSGILDIINKAKGEGMEIT